MDIIDLLKSDFLPNCETLKRHYSTLSTDWFGQSLTVPVHFVFAVDRDHFHFLASRKSKAFIHPQSETGKFQAELWKYDVAEFFLRAPNSTRYLEFNLAPNGGWWSCLFKDALVPMEESNTPLPGVIATGHSSPDGWEAHARIPLSFLVEHLDFGPDSRLNATFILDSPDQIFVTAGPPAPGKPNFHRPGEFPGIRLRSDVTL